MIFKKKNIIILFLGALYLTDKIPMRSSAVSMSYSTVTTPIPVSILNNNEKSLKSLFFINNNEFFGHNFESSIKFTKQKKNEEEILIEDTLPPPLPPRKSYSHESSEYSPRNSLSFSKVCLKTFDKKIIF